MTKRWIHSLLTFAATASLFSLSTTNAALDHRRNDNNGSSNGNGEASQGEHALRWFENENHGYCLIQCLRRNTDMYTSIKEERDACCEMIVGAAVRKMESAAWCLQNLAQMPQLSDRDDTISHVLLYPTRHATAKGILQPPPLVSTTQGSTWSNHAVWDERGWSVEVVSRQAVSTDSIATTTVTSTLSEAGGMHRDLHSVLEIDLPVDDNSTIAAGDSYNFTTTMLLFLPANVFINTEDCLVTKQANVTLQLQTAAGETIDQEEPAFATRPHLVLVHIQGQVATTESLTTTRLVVPWTTLLHVRYPAPAAASTASYDFTAVTVPAPVFLQGTLQSHSTGMLTTTRTLVSDTNAPSHYWDPALLTVWVATAKQDDYWCVTMLTLAAAVVGAGIMLRDIARVAVWE